MEIVCWVRCVCWTFGFLPNSSSPQFSIPELAVGSSQRQDLPGVALPWGLLRGVPGTSLLSTNFNRTTEMATLCFIKSNRAVALMIVDPDQCPARAANGLAFCRAPRILNE